MAEIGFYHLTRTGLERALPRLLERTLQTGERALVLCAAPDQIDALLWKAEAAWLPHNSGPDDDPDLQPIWLSGQDEPPPNGARFLFLLDGLESLRLDAFARVFDLFDGRDPDAVAAARRRWRAAKQAGHALTYWRQTERGGWERG